MDKKCKRIREMMIRLDENGKVTVAFYEWALECCRKGIEIFVPIVGWEENYEVSNFGNVKSLARRSWNGHVWFEKEERILSPNMGTNGYLSIQLCIGGKIRRREIHRIKGLNFIPNPENKETINHDSGVKTDLKLTNLFWNTYTENNKHAFRTGLKKPSVQAKNMVRITLQANQLHNFQSTEIR